MSGSTLQCENEAQTRSRAIVTEALRLPQYFLERKAQQSLRQKIVTILALVGFSLSAFLVMGYHPGIEDDGVYLAAIQSDLNPALYPHDAAFFKVQLKTTLFDSLIAESVRLSRIPVAWTEFYWQLISIFLLVATAWQIVAQLFEDRFSRYGAMIVFTAMFTLPVTGTALYIADQYLHPRTLASALILFGVSRVLANRPWQAAPFVVGALLFHPLMGAYGASFCSILSLCSQRILATSYQRVDLEVRASPAFLCVSSGGLGWIFKKQTPVVLSILRSRHWFCLYQWTWYEWAGVIGPLVMFWIVLRVARGSGNVKLAMFSLAILNYSFGHLMLGMLILGPGNELGLAALEPMRYLHLAYVFMVLVGGALLGKHILHSNILRWIVLFVVANGGMLYAQRQLFPGTEHLEVPWRQSANPWIQAFQWIRLNTPKDAYFALDPRYLEIPGEDFHGFRALAQRSVLCDEVKDASVVTKAPELASKWQSEVDAQRAWDKFEYRDFLRLKSSFGVSWVVLATKPPSGLACRWHNDDLFVCEIP